jgi:hypothetical protein
MIIRQGGHLGDPKECRERAAYCAKRAATASSLIAREKFAHMAGVWLHLAVQLEEDKLSAFANLTNPHAWTGHFRGSPVRWSASDGEAVVGAVKQAAAHPVERPFDPAKLKKVPPILKAPKIGSVVIPQDEDEAAPGSPQEVTSATSETEQKETTAHTEIQWLLLKLGSEMGLNVWVARNDRSKAFNGQMLGSIHGLRQTLPRQADEATTKTIELIDVLWLQGNSHPSRV